MSELELEVWQRVAALAQSPSHDFHHIVRVQEYVDQLGEVLGVDTELVRIAAILHDLGRGDETRRHGLSSIEASKEMAEEVLGRLDLSDEARKTIIEAIESHDQPDLSPEDQAGRILKDADFLAGFGAWGVLRIAMWSGETGRRVEDVLQRMTEAMERRLDNLENSVSRDTALREVLFARQFHAELMRPAMIASNRYPGFYVVIEGISGAGKNTVAEEIIRDLKSRGIHTAFVEEPGETFRSLRDALPNAANLDENRALKKALMMADRAEQSTRALIPNLSEGSVVVSVRSYLSTAVYQCQESSEALRTLMEHTWMPICDLLLLLDVQVDVAVSRIRERDKPEGDYETPDQLQKHRNRYLELSRAFPARHLEVIDASLSKKDVVEAVVTVLTKQLEGERI